MRLGVCTYLLEAIHLDVICAYKGKNIWYVHVPPTQNQRPQLFCLEKRKYLKIAYPFAENFFLHFHTCSKGLVSYVKHFIKFILCKSREKTGLFCRQLLQKKICYSLVKTVQTCNKCQPVLPQSYNIHLKLYHC